MRAKYGPTGVTYDANEIGRDDPRKPGPWICDGEGCGVRYTNHRLGGMRKSIGRGTRERGEATFAKPADVHHGRECYLNQTETYRRLQRDHTGVVNVQTGVLRVQFDTEDSRPGQTKNGASRSDFSGLTPTRYGAVFSAARSIAAEIEKHAGSVNAMNAYGVRCGGLTYDWAQFAFGPSMLSLARLEPERRRRIRSSDRRQDPNVGPWFVQGTVTFRPTLTADSKSVQLRLTGFSDGLPATWIHVFAPKSSSAGAALLKAERGDTVAVLSNKSGFLDGLSRPSLSVIHASQVHVTAS